MVHKVNYAAKHRRSGRRASVIGAVLIAALCASAWLPTLSRRLSLLWLQRQCLNHVPLPNSACLEAYADLASAPPAKDGWTEVAAGAGLIRYRGPPSYCRNYLFISKIPLVMRTDSLVFCHGMKSVDGSARLVMIFADGRIPIEVGNNLSVLIFKPGSVNHAAVATQVLEPVHDAKNVEASSVFRLFDGMLVPGDPSRMIMDYEIDGRRGRIEGQLSRSGSTDRMELHVLNGPAFETDQVFIGGDSISK